LAEYTKILSDAGIHATGFSVDAADPDSIAAAFAAIKRLVILMFWFTMLPC